MGWDGMGCLTGMDEILVWEGSIPTRMLVVLLVSFSIISLLHRKSHYHPCFAPKNTRASGSASSSRFRAAVSPVRYDLVAASCLDSLTSHQRMQRRRGGILTKKKAQSM